MLLAASSVDVPRWKRSPEQPGHPLTYTAVDLRTVLAERLAGRRAGTVGTGLSPRDDEERCRQVVEATVDSGLPTLGLAS